MLNVGIIDIDGHNFPNLALMKISAWHKARGDSVEICSSLFGHYDIAYKSKVFTYTPDDENIYNTKKEIKGGTGYNFEKLSPEMEHVCPDYNLFHCEHAYGFLTRGCPNECQWCIVPKKEGNIKAHTEITEFISDKKSVILLDNNVLASDHGINQIEKIIKLKLKVDFNQGLDARLIDNIMAKLLSKVKWLTPLRMACDTMGQIKYIENATKLLRKHNCTPKNYFIYTLVKDIPDALERVNFLKKLKLDPFAQAYIDFSDKNRAYFFRAIMENGAIIVPPINSKELHS